MPDTSQSGGLGELLRLLKSLDDDDRRSVHDLARSMRILWDTVERLATEVEAVAS